MTIASTVNENNYIGSDSTDTFSYVYKIFAETDLLVTQRDASDVETILVLNTDYTVTGVKETTGGTIVLTAGNLATDFALSIKRVRPITQITDIRNLGDMFPETIEDTFDSQIMIMQFLDNNISRAVRIPETTINFDTVLTEPEALKWSRVNAAGTGYEWVDAGDFSTLMTTVNASLTLNAGELSVTNPLLFGVATGTADVITLSVTPTPAALTNNLRVYFEASGANTITTPTLDVNGLGAKTIVKESDTALVAGDIPGANARGEAIFDASLDKWVLLNPVNPSALLMVNPIVLPAGSASAPAVGWGDTGFYESSTPNVVNFTSSGVISLRLSATGLQGNVGNSPIILNEASSSVNPTLVPNLTTLNTGIGSGAAGQLSSIVEGVEIVKAVASGLTVSVAAASPPAANTLTKESIINGWIDFNGTGTIAINDSFNVDSITDNGVGDYTVTWDTDFANINYAVAGSTLTASASAYVINYSSKLVGSCDVLVTKSNDLVRSDLASITFIAIGIQ